MAIVNSIRQLSIMGASPGTTVTMPGVAVTAATANLTVNIPQPGNINYGMLRIKSLTPATGTSQIMSIRASDGTNSVQVYGGQPAAVTLPADSTVFPIVTDINATSLIISYTSSAAGTVDIEFAGV